MFFLAMFAALFAFFGMFPGLTLGQSEAQPAQHGFMIFYGLVHRHGNVVPFLATHYTFVPDDAPFGICNQIMAYPGLRIRDDVSGDKYGVRLSGGTNDAPDDMEFNGRAIGHYTIYKGRGYTIWPLDGDQPVGTCEPDYSIPYDCDWLNNTGYSLSGTSMFRCKSDVVHIYTDPNTPKKLVLNETES
ncbi:hypothetical protein PG993_002525 [Apiospora rasikravindrae]|uniref:Uncharacterized protein n=1 Tax=Apiospora rasikravindrae TaxID=990691 RepID=A0ABR1TZ51_9PEZI